MLRSVAGLERPDSGTVEVGHGLRRPPDLVPPEHRGVGMVFQDWALFPHLDVRHNVGFGLRASNEPPIRSIEPSTMVDLAGFGDRMPAQLSGGQQQRVALARALASNPSVLLLDEPFSNLDSALRTQIRGDVRALLAELGITTVFVTHDQEEAFLIGEIVAVMFDGTIRQTATRSKTTPPSRRCRWRDWWARQPPHGRRHERTRTLRPRRGCRPRDARTARASSSCARNRSRPAADSGGILGRVIDVEFYGP